MVQQFYIRFQYGEDTVSFPLHQVHGERSGSLLLVTMEVENFFPRIGTVDPGPIASHAIIQHMRDAVHAELHLTNREGSSLSSVIATGRLELFIYMNGNLLFIFEPYDQDVFLSYAMKWLVYFLSIPFAPQRSSLTYPTRNWKRDGF
jgi:hypothetical protein